MKHKDTESVCASCGLSVIDSAQSDKHEHFLCSICTLDNTTEPKFEAVVYALTIGYFMNKHLIDDQKEALEKAYDYVCQLPFWREKEPPFPSLAGLTTAKMLTALSSAMNALEFDDERLSPPDFFISYSWQGFSEEVVASLVTALKNRGYQVWYDKDTWGTESGKTKDWMKRGINNARHCILLLSEPYFGSKNCVHELETMLSTKNLANIFPIWLKDINKSFLQQEKHGEKILDIVGIGWKDWEGNIEALVEALIKLANYAEGLKEYNSVPLVFDDVRLLERIQVLIDEPIPLLNTKPDAENPLLPNFGFYHDKNRVTDLYLRNKGLKALPKSICQCNALRTLVLAHNQLTSLPESFHRLNELENLDLSDNKLNAFPESICKLTKLTRLYFGSNEIYSLPETVENLTNLIDLSLYNNNLRALTLPSSLFELTNLKKLNLRANRLRHLPLSIGKLENLKALKVSHNRLTTLPPTFGRLTNLRRLELNNNQLKELPDSFGNLTELTLLKISNNNLELLPDEIGNLINLQKISLGHNQLKTLPETFKLLQNLKHLELQQNKFEDLPETICNLKNLNFLLLQRNQLSSLPKTFENMINLQVLNLKGNQFEALPSAVKKLRAQGCKVRYTKIKEKTNIK
ncbi:MAG: leucine-rich repeat domain-containing protein [Candidatus Hodarchaeota archaeon]